MCECACVTGAAAAAGRSSAKADYGSAVSSSIVSRTDRGKRGKNRGRRGGKRKCKDKGKHNTKKDTDTGRAGGNRTAQRSSNRSPYEVTERRGESGVPANARSGTVLFAVGLMRRSDMRTQSSLCILAI